MNMYAVNQKRNQTIDIDFVIPWVDGADPEWQKVKRQYSVSSQEDANEIRYRDWDLLRYWFRGVEKFAPWVRKIHFVTWGHIPAWLNTTHPKLNIVKHEDYIPSAFLPTFSANPIELNLHRISGLAEHFVYFNDDMFLIRPVDKTFFFKNGLPCDDAILSPIMITNGMQDIGRIVANDMAVINSHFEKQSVLTEALGKWLNPKYGKQMLRTLCLLPWRHFPGFFNDHLPQAFLKSTFEEIWAAEPELLNEVSTHRFRDYGRDVNQWLMRYWQFCENRFVPASSDRGKDLLIDNPQTLADIRQQRYHMICLNDRANLPNFSQLQQDVQAAFEQVLPIASSFEL